MESLSSSLVKVLEVIVNRGEERLDDAAESLNAIIGAAADPDSGELYVPLPPDQRMAARKAIEALGAEAGLDEDFVMTVQSWMKKSRCPGAPKLRRSCV